MTETNDSRPMWVVAADGMGASLIPWVMPAFEPAKSDGCGCYTCTHPEQGRRCEAIHGIGVDEHLKRH